MSTSSLPVLALLSSALLALGAASASRAEGAPVIGDRCVHQVAIAPWLTLIGPCPELASVGRPPAEGPFCDPDGALRIVPDQVDDHGGCQIVAATIEAASGPPGARRVRIKVEDRLQVGLKIEPLAEE